MATAEIRTRATLDHKGFDVGIKKMQQQASSFAKGGLARIGAGIGAVAGVGALIEFSKGAVALGDQLDDLADRTGLTTDALQAMISAGVSSGADQESMIAGLIKLKEQMDSSAHGGKELAKTMKELGINADEMASMGSEGLLEMVSTARRSSDLIGDMFGNKKIGPMSGALGVLGEAGSMGNLVTAKRGEIIAPEILAAAGQVDDTMAKWKKTLQTGLLEVLAGTDKLTEKQKEEAKEKAKALQAERQAIIEADIQSKKDARANFVSEITADAETAKTNKMKSFSASASEAADQFTRIGGFSGAQLGIANTLRSLAERQLEETKLQTEAAKDIAKKLGEG